MEDKIFNLRDLRYVWIGWIQAEKIDNNASPDSRIRAVPNFTTSSFYDMNSYPLRVGGKV